MANIIEINELDNPSVAIFTQLTEAQLRNRLEPEKGIFIAESPKVIKVALEAGYQPVAMLTERKHIEGDAQEVIAMCGDIPIYTGDHNLLSSITGYTLTRGVLCAMRRPRTRNVEEICDNKSRIVILDGVVDSTNIGAIFRSAAALGIDAVLLTPTCCDPLNRRAVRVSMGTVFQVPWCYLCDTPNQWPQPSLQRLKVLGFKSVAMALADNSISLDSPTLAAEPQLAIIMGTEGDGLSDSIIDSCDYVVRIPMAHGVDSLNVAAASAVAFWQLRINTH
ncbi:MAG: RNA methyltransferase [Bacteroidales bacterium]|nr:RNA methyltransferase [Bacteroidales bacterium]